MKSSLKNLSLEIDGIYTAIITPFKNSKLDIDAFLELCQLQVSAGIDGIVVSGTTGEAPTLTDDEKLELIRSAKKAFKNKIKIMGGSGNNNTLQSVELSRSMAEAGADSLLVVTPPYNKPSLDGLKKHFHEVGEASDLPLCLYHVPGRTGQKLSAEALAELCSQRKIVAVKEASADLILFSKARQLSDAKYLSGDDFTFLPSLALGGKGVISVLTNVFPKSFVKMYQYFNEGQTVKAQEIHDAVFDFTENLFIESNPCPTKSVLSGLGLCTGELRLPLSQVHSDNAAKIMKSYEGTAETLSTLGAL